MQDSDGQSCPFCRTEIKGTEQVVVDPFDPQGTTWVKNVKNTNSPSNSNPDEDEDNFEVCMSVWLSVCLPTHTHTHTHALSKPCHVKMGLLNIVSVPV